jgi:RNA polymerase sigma factor (sigma-70 family)
LTDFTFDAEYLVRLRDREPGTLAHFCDFFYLPVRNSVRHRVTVERADDLVQDIFVATLTRIDAGEPNDPSKLPGYVFGVCRNVLLQGWRKARKHLPVDIDLSFFPDLEDRADVRLIKELDKRVVQNVMQRLAGRDRDAINRVFFLQQDRDAAAKGMNISQGNLRVILCRAMKRFRIEWDIFQQGI